MEPLGALKCPKGGTFPPFGALPGDQGKDPYLAKSFPGEQNGPFFPLFSGSGFIEMFVVLVLVELETYLNRLKRMLHQSYL